MKLAKKFYVYACLCIVSVVIGVAYVVFVEHPIWWVMWPTVGFAFWMDVLAEIELRLTYHRVEKS